MNRLQRRFSFPRVFLILYCIFTNSAVGAQKEGSSKLFDQNIILVKGTVKDKKGAVIPGLTVSAVHLWFDPNAKELKESGRRSNTVTDSLGRYLLFYTPGGDSLFKYLKPDSLLRLLGPGKDFIEVWWDKTLIYRSAPLEPLLMTSPLVHDITLK